MKKDILQRRKVYVKQDSLRDTAMFNFMEFGIFVTKFYEILSATQIFPFSYSVMRTVEYLGSNITICWTYFPISKL